ncbi:MAG: FAD-dependent oxidoreductase [Candidatus Melainabacteria bacterium]
MPAAATNQATRNLPFHLLVLGDEIESCLTAVSAARAGARVCLLRQSTGLLGGLSTRGGLAYMDITPGYYSPLFYNFLLSAQVRRVALCPHRAGATLARMLSDAGVTVLSGHTGTPVQTGDEPIRTILLSNGQTLETLITIDATPDADWARALGAPFIHGLGGIMRHRNYLGVTPVFRVEGVDYRALQAFEASIRANPALPDFLAKALPHHPPALREAFLTRPTYAFDEPGNDDYLDILSPVIGVDYHCWRHGDPATYPTTDIIIDGGNIARLSREPDGPLAWNGMVCRAEALSSEDEDPLNTLIRYSQGVAVPEVLLAELAQFERYLQERGGFENARVIPPEALYVRQTVTMLARRNMTARQALLGGVAPEASIGTASYWLDLRGAELWREFPDEEPPKPVFNVGLEVCLPAWPKIPDFAVVGRAAGYSPIGQGAGRIIQHNAMVGEALGIAAAIAAREACPLESVIETGIPAIRDILDARYRAAGLPWPEPGRNTATADYLATSRLLEADEAVVDTLRRRVTEGLLVV